MKHNFTISTQLITEEAKKRGINIFELYPGKIALLEYKKHQEFLYNQFVSQTTSVAHQICINKEITAAFLKRANIRVPEGRVFEKNEFNKALKYAEVLKWPVVLKPTASAHGNFVFADIESKDEFISSWKKAIRLHKKILVQEKFEGMEFRIMATCDKVIGVTHRMPANVVGDGINTIKQLVETKNKDLRRAEDVFLLDHSKHFVKIKIDNVAKEALSKQNLRLNSIPKKDQIIFLRTNSNISTGGDSVDFTDKIHPSVKKIAIDAIRAIPGLLYGGVDLLTRDITVKQSEKSYVILEINESPGIDIHHFPYEGKSRDVAKEIIDLLFPETKEKN